MEIKKHNTAGCFLVRRGENGWEIVLLYKKWSEDNQGWVPPKGHVEKDETIEEAAKRETTEETGYNNFDIVDKLETLHLEYTWDDGFIHQKDIHYFLAKLTNNQKMDLNQSEQEKSSTLKVEWITLERAEKDLLFDDEREILRKVIKILDKQS